MNSEQDDIDRTIEFIYNKIINEKLSLLERQALLFYTKELKSFRGCPDDQKFTKPGKCIGGYGDQMVFKQWILRDKENNVIANEDGEPLIKKCCFQDLHTYLKYVRGERKVERQYVEFYNGMPQEEYIKWQMMKLQNHRY